MVGFNLAKNRRLGLKIDFTDEGELSPITTVLLPEVLGVFCPELNGEGGA